MIYLDDFIESLEEMSPKAQIIEINEFFEEYYCSDETIAEIYASVKRKNDSWDDVETIIEAKIRAYYRLRKYNEVLRLADELNKVTYSNTATIYVAWSYEALKDGENAIANYKKAISEGENTGYFLLLAACCAKEYGKLGDAFKWYIQGLPKYFEEEIEDDEEIFCMAPYEDEGNERKKITLESFLQDLTDFESVTDEYFNMLKDKKSSKMLSLQVKLENLIDNLHDGYDARYAQYRNYFDEELYEKFQRYLYKCLGELSKIEKQARAFVKDNNIDL